MSFRLCIAFSAFNTFEPPEGLRESSHCLASSTLGNIHIIMTPWNKIYSIMQYMLGKW